MTTFRLLKPSRLAIEWEICKSWGAGNKEGERNNRFLLRFLICLSVWAKRASASVCYMCVSASVCHVCVSAHMCHVFVSASVCYV